MERCINRIKSNVMEKQTVFIKRYPSNGELPKVDNKYYLTDEGLLKFEKGKWYSWWEAGQYTPAYPNFYLEEIELPSEEEVNFKYPLNSEEPYKTSLNVGCRQGANFILPLKIC